jgi:arylsulfatase A-like enzyme
MTLANQKLGALALCVASALGCGGSDSASTVLGVGGPLHLEEHLDWAQVEGSEVPENVPAPKVWKFDRPQPEWRAIGYPAPDRRLPHLAQMDDAIRLTVSEEKPGDGWERPHGGIVIDVPDWNLIDWAYVVVRLRTNDSVDHLELGFNVPDLDSLDGQRPRPFETYSGQIPVIHDGSAQDYVVPTDQIFEAEAVGSWRQLGVYFGADEPVTVDILSVSVVPSEADYAASGIGVRMTSRSGQYQRAVFTHAPATLAYRVEIPPRGRLDFAFGVLREDAPVTFRVRTTTEDDGGQTLLEETYADRQRWASRSLDLSHIAGQKVTLTFETEAEREGTVALWAAPTLSGRRATTRPNVILYIIDGAGADFMSVYGYNRRTTPNMERLAAQGAVFERAHSNSTWSKPSTASFMTSLHHSVLGGYRGDSDRIPEAAVTMVELLHANGYLTGVFDTNPFAASMSGLQSGADILEETGIEPNNSESSRLLHEAFWRWRTDQPAEPFWVHFQTTDIHEPFNPVAPFSGLYVDPDLRESYEEWDSQLFYPGPWRDLAGYEELGIDPVRYAHAQQGLYDEAMAHNDYRIGELVARLQERGEWDDTLLIIAADHGYPAACHRLNEPLAPIWGPMFNSHETRIPMIFVWPGRIPGGLRFSDPVSMIDVLPTVLDLLDLPIPEIAQGQSLAPLLLGEKGWESRPVILDEFIVDSETGELRGLIEIVDGRWGASLEIGEDAAKDIGTVGAEDPDSHRPAPLLLYDLWNDPYTLNSLHEEHPDLVAKYSRLLQKQWALHRELAEKLGEGGQVPVTPDQLEGLRALGYID